MKLKYSLLSFFILIASTTAFSQKVQLINSGEVIDEAKVLYDSGKYEEAIKKYLTVPERDTNYVYMLGELALTYIAHEKYEEALKTCATALEKKSIYKAQLFRLQAIATEKKDGIDKAIPLFEKAMARYPFDVAIRYSLGIVYYNNKKYDKAIDEFFKILEINPFHSGTHYNLGKLATGMGRKTHAIFSNAFYLSVNNSDNNRLVFLDRVLSNQITDEGSLTPVGENACEKLDQILKSKIALDKNYKTKVPMDAPVVKQTEMFFEQLSLIKKGTSDRWVDFYLPIFSALKEQNQVEPFMYNMIASANSEVIAKWRKKNEKVLSEFYTKANSIIQKKRELLNVPVSFGYKEPVQAWFYEGNKLEGLGKKQGDTRMGPWRYYYTNSELSAEGKYNDTGKKVGVWKYFYDVGLIKSIENMDTGEVTVYNTDGAKSQHFFLKDDEIDGVAEVFNTCGNTIDKINYKMGKRSGKGEAFYASGKSKIKYEYADGRLNGDYTAYFENGQIEYTAVYKNGELDGLYTEYHASGKLRMKGMYVAGKVDAVWSYYYSNGRLEKTGAYKQGMPIGEWVYYEKNGTLSEKRNFNDEGKWNGENTTYHDGKIHYVNAYKNGLLVKSSYYDKDGKTLGKFENGGGTFSAKIFYATGQLNGEGAYKKGKLSGLWKYYYPEGSKLSEYTYEDGVVNGNAYEYYKNGTKHYDFNFKDGDYHGYFIEYAMDGGIIQEGWYQYGQRQQQWFTYSPSGKVSADYYYEYDRLRENAIDYNVDGKLFSTVSYKDGVTTDIQHYKSDGTMITKRKEQAGKILYETFYATGKRRSVSELWCGDYSGAIGRWYADGTVNYSYSNMNNNRHGLYQFKDVNGQTISEGNYENGAEEGFWKWNFINGKVETVGKYVGGDRDSIWTNYYQHGVVSSLIKYIGGKRVGVSQYFSPDGKLMLEKMFDNDHLVAMRSIDMATQKTGEWVKFTGNSAITINYPNGAKAYEETYKNGFIDGAKKIYFPNGKLYSEYTFVNGDYNGAYTIYHANGKVYDTGNYQMDNLMGERKFYNEDGTLLLTENYLLGSRQGKVVLYKNGAKVKEYIFWADTIEQ